MSIKERLLNWQLKLLKNKLLTKINICLGVFYLLRLVLCLLPQHGYLHPDEFFQFTEPIAVKTADFKGKLTWEWDNKQPIRSSLFPLLLGGSVLKSIKLIFGNNIICTYLVLVLPRLLFTLLSFSIDYTIYQCCSIAKITKIKEVLLAFATSYLTIVHLCHTLTNSIECCLFSLLILTIFKCIKNRKENNIKQLAFLLTIGIWNRPTFILFALYPLYYWATIENHQSRKLLSNAKIVAIRLFKLLSLVKIFSFGLILFDTAFYQTDYVLSILTSKNFNNINFKRFIITPLNFIQFNYKSDNLKQFGVNPLYLHLALNLQLLFCFLGIYLIKDIYLYCRILLDKKQRTIHFKTNFRTVLALSCLPPLIILSLIPHQEPRFLLPLLVPLVLLYGSKCFNNRALLIIWILFNLILTGFYGFVHQAGVTRSIFAIKTELSTSNAQTVNIIYSSTYLPPEHLFAFTNDNLTKYKSKINFIDLSVSTQFPDELLKTLNTIKSRNERHQTYLIAPSTLNKKIINLAKTLNLKLNVFRQLFPTFDFESFELPASLSLNELRNKFSTNIYLIN